MKEHLSYFLFAFTSLFTMVDPIGAMPLYLHLTEKATRSEALRMARRAVLFAFLTMIFFALTGQFVFSFFNVSIDGLRIVGGILFFMVGYDMLQAKTTRTKLVSEKEADEMAESAISPLAVPMLCGPGAITASVVLHQEAHGTPKKAILYLALVAVSLVTFLMLAGSKRILSLFGRSGRKVFSRLMGLIIMMVAVEFFFTGLRPYVQRLIER